VWRRDVVVMMDRKVGAGSGSAGGFFMRRKCPLGR
jgi:hypothetical protein